MIIAGLDEAGRGPWAGPLVAAAVILPFRIRIKGLRDSKQLNAGQREKLFEVIKAKAHWGIGLVTHFEIDEWGLTNATRKAFLRALENLVVKPDQIWIDGKQSFNLGYPTKTIVRGDEKVRTISAASILAKVTRDNWMIQASHNHPNHFFHKHKGYGTRDHQQAIQHYGLTEIHRRSYKPIQIHLKNIL